jgi:hypothetical protein
MAKEPDNLVLVLVREMRTEMGERFDASDRRFEALEKRFDKIDKDFETFKYQLTHIFGLSGMGNLHARQADEKADAVVDRQARLEAKVDDIDRRLKRVEEPA